MKNRYPSVEKPWLKYYPKNIIDSELPKCSIYEYLKENNINYFNRTALVYFGRKISYSELIKNIDIIAESFRNRGIKENDIVTILLPTLPETIYMFYALSKIGAISNMVDPRKSVEEIIEYTKSVNSKLLVVVDVAYNKVKNIKECTDIEEIIVVSPSESLPSKLKIAYNATNKKPIKGKEINNVTKWQDFYNTGKGRIGYLTKDEIKQVNYKKDRGTVIVYTGGTTGISKGVLLSNDNINAATFQCINCGLDFQRQQKWLNIMPPFIAYGIGNGLHLPLVCGMEVTLIPKFNSKKFDKLLLKHNPNHVTGVPTHYDSVINSKKLAKKSLVNLLSVVVGGDKLEESLENKVNVFLNEHNCNFNITKGYGLSEAMAAVCVTGKTEYNAVGSVGIPFSHTIISIFNPQDGKEMTYNEIGEICISSPNVMKSYYNNQEETDKIIKTHKDGLKWLHSGDLGYMDEDGKIFIVGRIKEMIVRHDGFKVYPILIENVILSHQSVLNCKVVGVSDKSYSQGELPKAFIILKDNVRTNDVNSIILELKKLCNEKLAEYLQPVDIVVKDSFPQTAIGKIDFIKLKKEEERNK